jgi:hypothetical protein
VLDGWGGAGQAEVRGYFNPEDRVLHIDAQETLADIHGVDAFAEEHRRHSVVVYIDMPSLEWTLRRGTSRPSVLMPMVRQARSRWAYEWGGARQAEARGYFNPEDRALHIEAQEILADIHGVDAIAEEHRGHSLVVYIDMPSLE